VTENGVATFDDVIHDWRYRQSGLQLRRYGRCPAICCQREITNMFVSNILLCRFSSCLNNVKTVLFKIYCLCKYGAALWKTYNLGTLGKLRSCYHRCVKIFFEFRRRDSMTSILLMLGLPSFNTVLANVSLSFAKQWANCSKSRPIIRVMRNMNLNYWEWCLYFTLFHFIFPVYYIYVCRLSVDISCELWYFICVFVCLFSLSLSFCSLCFYGPCCLK